MLPDLIEAPPTVNVGFDFSLPHDLFTTLSLIVKSAWRDGFSDWVYEMAAGLSQAERVEIATLTPFLAEVVRGSDTPLAALPVTDRAWRELPAFQAYLAGQALDFYQGLVDRFVARLGDTLPEIDPSTPEGVRQLLYARLAAERATRGEGVAFFDADLAFALTQAPALVKGQLGDLLRRFGSAYLACLTREEPVFKQALAYHRRQSYRGDIDDIFAAVTGRALPANWHPAIDETTAVVFVPSPHIGPFFFIVTTGTRTFVSFNARTVGPARQAERATPEVVHLFPPLRALADETRLHILAQLQAGEQTQESLMVALGISQPAASRHLGLLERVGLLHVRRAMGVKYYSVNREGGRDVLRALDGLIA
ncbi:MAG: winged helix-turn-helix transcriptional regulator [Anaerolineae bacterium]|nr:winged helix-turn-helix transcriptional regulator [Anaerolineae bacterium]